MPCCDRKIKGRFDLADNGVLLINGKAIGRIDTFEGVPLGMTAEIVHRLNGSANARKMESLMEHVPVYDKN